LLRLYPLNHTIEPRLYFSITPALLVVALLASYLPARRASVGGSNDGAPA
jgi:hypothetical protein